MAVPLPGPHTRWRCALCGNLTRFDVLRTTRSEEYVHVDLAGVAVVDERRVLMETADRVTCRWCGAVDRVEVVPRPGSPATPGPELGRAGPGARP
jgi:RNase P subunit RPR2